MYDVILEYVMLKIAEKQYFL